jgi:hypothetical protein
LAPDISKTDLFLAIAQHIDLEIHRNYRLYPSNYIALDMLSSSTQYADKYTDADKSFFENYLSGQMAKIQIPDKDEVFLRERILTMYANPAKNHLSAL